MEGEGREGGRRAEAASHLGSHFAPLPRSLAPHVWMWADEPRLRVLQTREERGPCLRRRPGLGGKRRTVRCSEAWAGCARAQTEPGERDRDAGGGHGQAGAAFRRGPGGGTGRHWPHLGHTPRPPPPSGPGLSGGRMAMETPTPGVGSGLVLEARIPGGPS